MGKKIEEIIIPKEEAVFWLDKNGCWHNEQGKFQHKKIIDFFHAAIRKDAKGYYLSQNHGNYREKVYFCCEDGALFVFDVVKEKDIILVLNTKRQIKLKPRKLYVKDDSLYMRLGKDFIKFTERALMRISELLQYQNHQYYIKVGERKYKIPEL
ncbi:MAG: MFS transporter permease [Desulfobacterales bacterium]|nr:MAG: MFS transporter permease [Desulfobacterales bacterium]